MPDSNQFIVDGRGRRYGCAATLLWGLLICPAVAQELDEILVTATRREESLANIPISVVAVPGETLSAGVTRDLQELAVSVPNVSIGNGLTTDNVYMRGVGSGNERGFEQAVGLFVDDVYMPRSRQYRTPFLDVEHVEFVRGPQSVLFGLNATAGAIAIHTARSRPGDVFFARVTAGYELEFGGSALTTVIGGSPADTLGLRLAAHALDSGDGYWQNLFTGRDENRIEDRLLRGSMVFEPTDAVTVDARVEYSNFERDGGSDELYTDAGSYSDGSDALDWVRGQDASLLPLFPFPAEPGFQAEQFGFAASAEVAIGGGTFTGTLGYVDYDWSLYTDLDSGPARIVDSGIREPFEQSSIELQFASAADRGVQYIAGAYYASSELGQEQPNLVDGTVLLAPSGFPVAGFDAGHLWANGRFDQDESLISGYGMVNWHLGETVLLRGGVRYVRSDKDHLRSTECLIRRSDGTYDDPDAVANPNDALLLMIGFCPTPVDPARQSRSGGHLLPEVSVQWSPDETMMVYGKLSTSAKSGGFVAARIIIPGYFEYDDETATGLELGLKLSFAGGRGEVNAALFHSEYDDLQVNSFDPDTAAAIVGNAGEVRSRGLELDGRLSISDFVTIGAMLGFLDTEFSRFDSGPCFPGETTNPDGFSCDKSGMTLPNAPEVSGTFYVDVDAPLGSRLGLLAHVNVDFSSPYLTSATLDPVSEQAAYARLDARVGVADAGRGRTVSLIGKNLTNERINSYTEAFLGVYRGYMLQPRTIWLQGDFRFGH